MSVTAVVLAAGRSRRLGRAKALLRLDGRSLLEHVVTAARAGGASHIIVVVGAEDDASLVSRRHVPNGAHVVVGDPDGSPQSSLRRALPEVLGHLLLWPVDHPFADPALVQRLVARADPDHIVVPMRAERRAHPVLFGWRVVPELTRLLPNGARDVVRRDAARLIEVDASDADPRLLDDVDTPDDARRLGLDF